MTSLPRSRAVLIHDSCPETQARILAPVPVEWAVPDWVRSEGGLPQSTDLVLHRLRPGLPGDLLGRPVRGRSEYRLTMDANPVHIPEVISWLVTCSAWNLHDNQRLRIRGALHELLLNAVEHGTLELGFLAKRQALAEGRYEELLMRRLSEHRLRDRHVAIQVRYEKDTNRLTYRIADEGTGFKWRRLMARSHDTCGPDGANGRGIFLARSLLPSLIYNDQGNEVTISVPLA